MGDPSPSPPAPLDLGRLEGEARANAAKHVSSRFQVEYYMQILPGFFSFL